MRELQIPITSELREICKQISDMHLSEEEWAGIESSDMFQTNNFTGGYDAIETAFTFSFFQDNKEYWFQLTADEVLGISEGQELLVRGILAETEI